MNIPFCQAFNSLLLESKASTLHSDFDCEFSPTFLDGIC
jgi:hypothetical protein